MPLRHAVRKKDTCFRSLPRDAFYQSGGSLSLTSKMLSRDLGLRRADGFELPLASRSADSVVRTHFPPNSMAKKRKLEKKKGSRVSSRKTKERQR